MSTTDTFDPSENEGLVELKRRWECGHFGLDAHGVYGIDEALGEAAECLSMYDTEERNGLTYFKNQQERPVGPDGQIINDRATREYMANLLGRKTCVFCGFITRNNPCNSCYQMVRSAAMGEFIDQANSHPCFICDEGKIASQICTECMELLLGQ